MKAMVWFPASPETEITDREKVVILGGGPNRIGQGIEFDYCCVHAVFALRDAGYETIMVNCNPETVSTDYDTSDRLYFEPLTDEDVIELVRGEQARGSVKGVIVQFGGQTPLKLARGLETAGIPILGTNSDAIDLAEDRERFQNSSTILVCRNRRTVRRRRLKKRKRLRKVSATPFSFARLMFWAGVRWNWSTTRPSCAAIWRLLCRFRAIIRS